MNDNLAINLASDKHPKIEDCLQLIALSLHEIAVQLAKNNAKISG